MATFLAVAPKTFVNVLEAELKSKQFKVIQKSSLGIYFSGNWQDCLRAHLSLKTATRILLPVLEFNAYKDEELYNNILKHDFTKYITVQQNFVVESSVINCSFKDSRYLSLKVKDAIVDQFRNKYGSRPSISKTDNDLKVVVKGLKNNYFVALDTTGGFISDRGYRLDQGPAPLKEHLAASLIKLSGWKFNEAFIDPMCGSGTLAIEAAMMATQKSTMLKKQFAFQGWRTMISKDWRDTYAEVAGQQTEISAGQIFGFDHNPRMISVSHVNAKAAEVEKFISFKQQSVADFSMSSIPSKGTIIVNPPYGERLGDVQRLEKTYKELGTLFKKQFTGWDCWLLSGHPDLTKSLSLKSVKQIPVFNGPIECMFLHYPMY